MSKTERQPAGIARRRLAGQGLIGAPFRTPADVVARLGAVQAQDYSGAKWAVAQRTPGATDADIEQLVAGGTIVRTHVLRPTWHFVAAADIRWMLALTAPRVKAAMASYNRKLELDAAVFRRSHAALEKALRGGHQRTRAELAKILERARVGTVSAQRLGHLLMEAELDAVICSGARRGKQGTYALFDERVTVDRSLTRDEALAELAARYFSTRGPATAQDFAWWSGLTVADAKRAAEAASNLARETIDGRIYWAAADERGEKRFATSAHLLPNFDEYVVGYKDRSAMLELAQGARPMVQSSPLFANVVEVDGQLVGGWKRTLAKDSVVVEMTPVTPLSAAKRRAVGAQAKRYGEFLGLVARSW